jgi:hypothetical protein
MVNGVKKVIKTFRGNLKIKTMAYKMKGMMFKSPLEQDDKKKSMNYPHTGQVSDAKQEEINDNISLGKGPAKPKGIMDARPKSVKKGPHPDSDAHVGSVPTFSDQIGEAINNRKNNRPEPTYEGTDEFRKKKNISKSERTKRGV